MISKARKLKRLAKQYRHESKRLKKENNRQEAHDMTVKAIEYMERLTWAN